MTSPTTAEAGAPGAAAGPWADSFAQFTVFHAVCVLVCAATTVLVCLFGRGLLRRAHAARESRFCSALGGSMAVVAIGYTAYFLAPSQFSWQKSLPLQFCDLLVLLAPLSLLTSIRWIRTIVVFWGLGLSTQAFISPIVHVGYAHTYFWLFWGSHLAILMAAAYLLAVYRYRATVWDLVTVTVAMIVYTVTIVPLNIVIDANYGFAGRTKPNTASILDVLGPWPWRLVWMFLIQQVLMVGLYFLLRQRPAATSA